MRQAHNIIIYNLTENVSKETKTRIAYDRKLISKLAQAMDYTLNINDIRLYRVGKPGKGKVRPLKLIFKTVSDMKNFLGPLFNDQGK